MTPYNFIYIINSHYCLRCFSALYFHFEWRNENIEFNLTTLQILPVLEKNFPEKRQYAFWSIVISYLWAVSHRSCCNREY